MEGTVSRKIAQNNDGLQLLELKKGSSLLSLPKNQISKCSLPWSPISLSIWILITHCLVYLSYFRCVLFHTLRLFKLHISIYFHIYSDLTQSWSFFFFFFLACVYKNPQFIIPLCRVWQKCISEQYVLANFLPLCGRLFYCTLYNNAHCPHKMGL